MSTVINCGKKCKYIAGAVLSPRCPTDPTVFATERCRAWFGSQKTSPKGSRKSTSSIWSAWKQNQNQGSPNHQHNKTWIERPTNLFKTHLEWPGESAVAAALASPLHHWAKLCATTASSSDKTRLVSAPNTCMLHAFHLVTLTYASLIRTGTFAKLRPISCKVSSVKLSFKAKRQ